LGDLALLCIRVRALVVLESGTSSKSPDAIALANVRALTAAQVPR
jgi:hypothetical protein